MTDEQLLKKSYYKSFIEPNEKRQPIQVLGDTYLKEQNNLSELPNIRFAQGELYFEAKDYEAAIFKWGNINNELEPWAKKNMADAYFELELYSDAESIYTSIVSDSMTLNSEVLIQLFSLYIQEGKIEQAVQRIKQAVVLNPDYPTVTQLAKLFFEEQKDWENALELAVNETVRTEDMYWADIVIRYVENGYVKTVTPAYFSQVLLIVVSHDLDRFEKLAAALWKGFRQGEYYFDWLCQFNNMFEATGASSGKAWQELSALYQETYFDLLEGKFLLNEISDIMPGLLANWLKTADHGHQSFAAAAILAWNDLFPNEESELTSDAEKVIARSGANAINLEVSLNLFDSIVNWTEAQDISVSPKLKWLVERLADQQTHYVLVAGNQNKGTSDFFKALIGDEQVDTNSANVLLTDNEANEILELSDSEIYHAPITNLDDNTETNWRELKIPSVFLREAGFAFISPADLKKRNAESLYLADTVVFLINENDIYMEKERHIFMQIEQNHPKLAVRFLIIKSEHGQRNQTENQAALINSFFPEAKVATFSPHDTSWSDLQQLADFLVGDIHGEAHEEERAAKALFFVQKLLNQLVEKRVEKENNLGHSVNWNQQMVGKLTGAINQLHDVKSESISLVKQLFKKEKEEIRSEVVTTIPILLRETSAFVKEDSDFGKIHVELNGEMNKKIEEYIVQTALPKFHDSLRNWIGESAAEFNSVQTFLKDLAGGFNVMFEEERVKCECDFKVLDDWRRDVDRMTRVVQLDKVNILLRMTPAQVLLKSAGKVLGVLPKNKKMLCTKYKTFIENEEYTEIAESIADKLLMQIELFEKGLERDIEMFFNIPGG
ncbi:GTP-binding protein [Bacillus sp. T3]|uniref:tetratricopeptide repeat protein n=1 Tax=Bacillus sp. T3 TaxID=467262 RepID=UPI0029810F4E|nr:GTP-binding protein [Bacillus sp. T3]